MILVLGLASILVLALTALPLLILLLTSVARKGTYGFESEGFVLDHYIALLQQRGLLDLLLNTVNYVFGTIAIAVVFAIAWAWITERTDFRFKATVRVLMLVTVALPALIQGLGWTLLANPNNGLLNLFLRYIFDLQSMEGPFNIYSMGMMVAISGLLLTPPIYVMLAGVIRHLDYKLEFPAVLAGVPSRTIFTGIIIPVLLPGLLSVLIYMAMVMIQAFEIPLSIGLTAGIQVFSTRIYLLSSSEMGPPDYNLAAAFGVLLVAIALGLVLIYQHMTRRSERFAVITGKNYSLAVSKLGQRRFGVYAFAFLFFGVSLLPIMVLLWTSLLPFYDAPSASTLKLVSLNNFIELFQTPMFVRSLINTLIIVLVGASLTMVISFIIAYATLRPRGWLRRTIDIFAFLPIGIPHIVLGLAVLLVYVKTPLYGTIVVIILAQLSVNMVFAIRTLSAGLIQIDSSITQAARISGVGHLNIMARVLAPIIKTQYFNSWLMIFAFSVRDVGIPLIFLTSETVVLASALWLVWGYPDVPGAAALSIVMVIFLLAFIAPLQIWINRMDKKT